MPRLQAADADNMVGRSSVMQEVYKAIGRVALTDVTVLIVGESGTGKELVARAICQHSRRQRCPFLAVNCAALAEKLLEVELLGLDRGEATDLACPRRGKFEQAHRGTLLLDAIDTLSLPTQAKLLRILEDQQFERLGSYESIQADVRVIATTKSLSEKPLRAITW